MCKKKATSKSCPPLLLPPGLNRWNLLENGAVVIAIEKRSMSISPPIDHMSQAFVYFRFGTLREKKRKRVYYQFDNVSFKQNLGL